MAPKNRFNPQQMAEAALVGNIVNIQRDMETRMKQFVLEAQLATQGEQQQAMSFITAQVSQLFLRFASIQGAITMASNDYNDLLQTQADAKVDWVGVTLWAVLAALPEAGALSIAIDKLVKIEHQVATVAVAGAKVAGKFFDARKFWVSTPDSNSGLPEANEVLANIYDTIFDQMATAVELEVSIMNTVFAGGLPHPYQWAVTKWQRDVGTFTPVPASDLVRQSSVLHKAVLYDMLKSFTWAYVKIWIGSRTPGALSDRRVWTKNQVWQLIADVDDDDVEVGGLNSNQLDKIYRWFSSVPWADMNRPPIKGWRDLVLYWKAQIPGVGYTPTFRFPLP